MKSRKTLFFSCEFVLHIPKGRLTKIIFLLTSFFGNRNREEEKQKECTRTHYPPYTENKETRLKPRGRPPKNSQGSEKIEGGLKKIKHFREF